MNDKIKQTVLSGKTVKEIIDGPDKHGRHRFWRYWKTDYIPGRPDGEYIRSQIFHANLKDHETDVTVDSRKSADEILTIIAGAIKE